MSLWNLGETSLWSQCLYQSESYLILVLAWYRLHCQNSQTAGDIWTVCCHDDTIPWELFHHKWLSVTKLVFQDNWYRNAFCHKMAIIFTFWHANSGIKLWILSCITFDTYNYTRWPGNHGSQAISETFLTLFIAKICINSSPLSATYMCQWIWSSLVQMMACCLFAKPLTYRNKLQWNSDKKNPLHSQKCMWNIVYEMAAILSREDEFRHKIEACMFGLVISEVKVSSGDVDRPGCWF